jgi:hypothetical protein
MGCAHGVLRNIPNSAILPYVTTCRMGLPLSTLDLARNPQETVGSQPEFSQSAKPDIVSGELVGVAEFRWSLNTMWNPETPRILPFDQSPQNQ